MAHFISIAGPQSAGKTTAFKYLSKKYAKRGILFQMDMNPYIFKKSDHPKYISTQDFQEDLNRETIKLLQSIDRNTDVIMENGPMQVVYIEAYSGKRKAEEYFRKYVKLLKRLDPVIIMVDAKPKLSFKRRINEYLRRIKKHKLQKQAQTILDQYEKKIIDLYPLWNKWFKRFPFKKILIKNSYKKQEKYLAEIETVINKIWRTS